MHSPQHSNISRSANPFEMKQKNPTKKELEQPNPSTKKKAGDATTLRKKVEIQGV